MTEGRPDATRGMLLDDHDSFRQPLAFMLEREPDLTVVAQAGSLSEARENLERMYEEGDPLDVAVVDLDLPDGSGAGLCPNRRGIEELVDAADRETYRAERAAKNRVPTVRRGRP